MLVNEINTPISSYVPSKTNNPNTVVWSHSDHQADFFELPTDGKDMHEALAWLLNYYGEVKLWMGVENDEGAELLLTCTPANPILVESLSVFEEMPAFFEEITGMSSACVNE